MQFLTTDIKDFLGETYRASHIAKDDYEGFLSALKEYKNSLNELQNSGEDTLAADALKPFLQKCGFEVRTKYDQKGNQRIDLAILKNGLCEVLIEAKKPSNKNERFTDNKPNCKALHETILYYFYERQERQNVNIKFIISCDFYHFYIFRASDFDRLFYKSKKIQDIYKVYGTKDSIISANSEFYEECKKAINHKDFGSHCRISLFDDTAILRGLHLDLSPYLKGINEPNFRVFSHIFRLFHRDFLLGEFAPLDINALKGSFYNELFYILGLKQEPKDNKIVASPATINHQNTLLYKIISSPIFENINESERLENGISLIISWLNRILFLKLIEANLVAFNDDNKNERFLNSDKIKSFNDLNELFFSVFAKDFSDRPAGIAQSLKKLPYLNSSLFQLSEAENRLGFQIKDLNGDFHLAYSPTTILKDKRDFSSKRIGGDHLLNYLFDFLNAFDFSQSSDIDDIDSQKELISTSVLGTVFEQLNAYKDGSVFTPGFITSYMAQKSIERVVVNKFNEASKSYFKEQWNCQNIEDIDDELRRHIRKNTGFRNEIIAAAKTILNKIRICDPAVGSAHFLYSALNTMIMVHYKLGLMDTRYHLENKNDRLETSFSYSKDCDINSAEYAAQKELFELKKCIIENNLFGVDINPNSVAIARLRMWIELLKHSFYKDPKTTTHHTLEILPNIDINIKSGNSLLSYFPLNQSLQSYPQIKTRIEFYKKSVFDYQNGIGNRNDIKKSIDELKATFRRYCFNDIFSKEIKAFNEKCEKYSKDFSDYGISDLNAKYAEIKARVHKNLSLFDDTDPQKAQKALDNLISMHDRLYDLEGLNPFEWRFSFPEILGENGEFLGFDLIIANPPYIDYRKIQQGIKDYLSKKSQIYKISSEGSIYVYFIEKAAQLINKNGEIALINPINYLCTHSGRGVRNFINNNLHIIEIVDVSNIKVFKEIGAYTCINNFNNKCQNEIIKFARLNEIKEDEYISNLDFKNLNSTKIEKLSTLLDEVSAKIEKSCKTTLNDFCDIFCALSVAGFRRDVSHTKTPENEPFLEASDIFRYSYKKDKYLNNINLYFKENKVQIFKNEQVIFMARMTNNIRCCIAEKSYFGGKVNVLHNFKINNKIILAIMNSKLMSYFYAKKFFASHLQGGAFGFDTISVSGLPIPQITPKNQKIADEIADLVDSVISAISAKNSELATQMERKIDDLVYQLYGLNEAEIKQIESSV